MIDDQKIREALISMFSKIGAEYREAHKALKNDGSWVSFDVEEINQQEYAAIKKYFLKNYNSGRSLNLDKLGFPDDWASGDIFDSAFTNLLEWVGLEVGLFSKKPETFLSEFEERLKSKPVETIWIPLLRLDLGNGVNLNEPIKLAPLSVLAYPGHVERELLRREFVAGDGGKRAHHIFNLMVNHLGIKAAIPLGSNRDELKKKVMTVLEETKVLMTGLFGVSLDTPYFFSGIESAWCKFDSRGGGSQAYNIAQQKDNYRSLGEEQIKAVRHHIENIGYEHIKRFRVTSARLNFASKRDNPMDIIVDYAVAIEGLFGSSESTAKMCLAISFLVAEDAKERIAVYEKLKDLFVLRGEIVHGNTLEGRKEPVKRYKRMNANQAKQELNCIERIIKKALMVLMLNRDLYDSKKRTHYILGNEMEVIRSPYLYKKIPRKS